MTPTENVAILLGGPKLWLFAARGSKSAANLNRIPEATHQKLFLEEMIYQWQPDLSFSVQVPRETVRLLARAAQFVLTLMHNFDWKFLVSHDIWHIEGDAAVMERKCFTRCSGERDRTRQGMKSKCSGIPTKLFKIRKRIQTN